MDEEIHVESSEKRLIVLEARKKTIQRSLGIFLLFVVVFLFLRIFLRLLGANPESFFPGFVFFVTGIFLLPFWGIFPQFQDTPVAGDPTVDVTAFTAIFCYIVIVLLCMGITMIAGKIFKTRKQVKETVQESRPVDTEIVSEVVK